MLGSAGTDPQELGFCQGHCEISNDIVVSSLFLLDATRSHVMNLHDSGFANT